MNFSNCLSEIGITSNINVNNTDHMIININYLKSGAIRINLIILHN
jgi:hypothetical protein